MELDFNLKIKKEKMKIYVKYYENNVFKNQMKHLKNKNRRN